MTKLIGIHGKARSGKDTCAKHLWAEYGFTRIAFADPLKLAAANVFGLSREQTWDDTIKETTIPYWDLSPRRMFQLLGTDAVKPIFGEDVWIKRWLISYNFLKDTDDVVVPDVRSDLEAKAIRDLGGAILHLVRSDVVAVAAHSSESGITYQQGDFYLTNDGTIEQLNADLDDLVRQMDQRK